MKIGITMRRIEHTVYPDVRDSLSRDWSAYMSKTFPGILLIPLLNDPKNILKTIKGLRIEGIIFSNGGDWGEDKERDETEKKVFNFALDRELPILGVCRGFQVINILMGGGLEDDIGRNRENHINEVHDVLINKKSPFWKFEKKDKLKVNSFHKQGFLIDKLSPKLRAFALSRAGIVEGVFHRRRPILGMQWHPERHGPSREFSNKLIRNLFYK